ncbi:STAS domain-containing protein [Magnetococcus sp. PR-3]|uniref:STAS domain-containing protein n=1 Tax=Magnetococcus sp. PR-3 TaxID=3120355 RepID=UPI002FCE272B
MAYTEGGEIEIIEDPQETVVKIHVRFTAKQMHAIDRLKPSSNPAHRFVVDLSTTRFLDSSGMGFMLRLREQVEGSAHNLRIRGASAEMRQLLEAAQFNRLFKIE